MKSSDIIRGARNVLFERELIRGTLSKENGVCLLGALGVAAGHEHEMHQRVEETLVFVMGSASYEERTIIFENDDYSAFGRDAALREAVIATAEAIDPECALDLFAFEIVHRFNDGGLLAGVPPPSLDEVLDVLDRAEKIAETEYSA